MKMNNKFSVLLVLVVSAFLVGALWSSSSVYAAGPTKSGHKVVKSGVKRAFKASSMGKYRARHVNYAKAQLRTPPAAAPGTVCYIPSWTGSGYSWNAAASYGGAPTQNASPNVSQPTPAAGPPPVYQPQQASSVPNTVSVCYNVNPTTGCYTWAPCVSPPAPAWNAPAGAYRGSSGQISSQAPPVRSAAPVGTPAVSLPPPVAYPANPVTVCYSGCSPSYWTGTGWSACF
jgi:hypothetical protein